MFCKPHVVIVNMPTTVKGCCYLDSEGNICIALNARITKEEQKKAYRHELKHIISGQMDDPYYKEYLL